MTMLQTSSSQPPSTPPPFHFESNCRQLPYAMKKHWATRLHDDLRLQCNGVLLSWALNGKPIFRVGESRAATEMEDHDKNNIVFEGVHPTGVIMLWDCGSWEPITDGEDVLICLERGFLRFALRGGKLQGIWTLTRKSISSGTRRAEWTLFKEAELFDQASVYDCAAEVEPISIISKRTRQEIERDWSGRKLEQGWLFQDVDLRRSEIRVMTNLRPQLPTT